MTNFDTINIENIQSYFEYLENVKSIVFEPTLINGSHLNEVIHTDEDFTKFNLEDSNILNKIFQRMLFLCDKVSDKTYDIEKYDAMISAYFLMIKPKVPANVIHNMIAHLRSISGGFWTNLVFQGNYYEYRAPVIEGRDSGSAVENQISETSCPVP